MTKIYCSDIYGKYLVFPSSPTAVVHQFSLLDGKAYRVSLEVKDLDSNSTGIHSVVVSAFYGNKISVEIDSRHNENGYVDYTQEALFVGLASLNGIAVDPSIAVFTWTVSDSIGISVDLSAATMSQNSLQLPKRTLFVDNIYIIDLTVTYKGISGNASIVYSTMIDSHFNFEVVPATGIAFETKFIFSIGSEDIHSGLNTFIFGYLKNGKEYYLTRSSPKSLYTLTLPQGETANQLSVFWKVITKNMQVFHYEKTVTVSATTLDVNDFTALIDGTFSDTMTEAVQIKMMYEYFKTSMSSHHIEAVTLMLDGLQKDGANIRHDQDKESSLTISQTLAAISSDFLMLNDGNFMKRAFDIFTQIAITDNNQIASKYFIEFSLETAQNLFALVDNCLSALGLVDPATQQIILQNSQIGLENVFRGALVHFAPGSTSLSLTGANVMVNAGKITSNGITVAADMVIHMPASALPSANYLQVTLIGINQPAYPITVGHPEGILRSGMIRVSLEKADAYLAAVGDRVYSEQLSLSNLLDPIIIEIPYTGGIGPRNTISWGYTLASGDTIQFTGITSTVYPGKVKCATTHLTDFILEEHLDPYKSIIDPVIPVEVTHYLNAYKSFAFWISLILILILPLLIIFAIKKDRKDKQLFPIQDLVTHKVHVYNQIYKNIKVKPLSEDAFGNPEYGAIDRTDFNVTANNFQNTQVFSSSAVVKKTENLKVPMKSEEVRHLPSYQSELSKDSSRQENFKKTSSNFFEEQKNNSSDEDIFEEKHKVKIIEHEVPVEGEGLNKRKRKKRRVKKRKVEETKSVVEENKTVAESTPVVQEEPITISPPVDNEQIQREQTFQEKPKEDTKINENQLLEETKLKEEISAKEDADAKKEDKNLAEKPIDEPFQFDPDSDYEGGDKDDDDKIKPYDYDYDDDVFDDTLKPKKRKKKLLKKKKKKPILNDTLNSTMGQALGPPEISVEQLIPNHKDNSSSMLKSKNRPLSPNSAFGGMTQNEFNETFDGNSINLENEFDQKPNNREYSIKYSIHALYFGYRVTNFFASYDNRFTRLWRLFIFYIEMFFMMFIWGIIFIQSGDTKEVNEITGYQWFGYSMFTIALDRILHMIILFILTQLRKRPGADHLEYQEGEDHDITQHQRTFDLNLNDRDQDDDKEDDAKSHLDNWKSASKSPETANIFMKKAKNDVKFPHSPKEGKKQTEKNMASLLLFIAIATVIIVFFWVFIIMMSTRYSERGGQLWGYMFGYTSIFTFFFIEPFYVFCVSIILYKRRWNYDELI